MHFIPILAAAAKEPTSVMDAMPHLMGMVMVLVTLAVLWGVCALTAKLIQLLLPAPAEKPAPAAAPAPAASQQPTPAAAAGIAPEIIAVIAAAVATATGKPHRIVSIKRQSTSWEKAGRQSVLTSHRIR